MMSQRRSSLAQHSVTKCQHSAEPLHVSPVSFINNHVAVKTFTHIEENHYFALGYNFSSKFPTINSHLTAEQLK
jgi:predicted permease